MTQAEITVVICLFNAEKYIGQTLKSLEEQTYTNFNLLILNDGSTDKSAQVAKDFIKCSTLIPEIVEFDTNCGTAYLRNFALSHVNTKFMMFFDADDLAQENLIEELYKKIKSNTNLIAVSCYSKYIDENGNRIHGGQYIGSTTASEFKERACEGKLTFMLPPTLFTRKAALDVGGYRLEGFPINDRRYQDLSEDLDLWSRMSDLYLDDKIMITIPKPLFKYRKITSSISASKQSLYIMQLKIQFIKHNLKQRRAGQKEVDFITFQIGMTRVERAFLYMSNESAYFYRMAGFSYVEKKYLRFIYNLLVSFIFSPSYIFDKIKSNVVSRREA